MQKNLSDLEITIPHSATSKDSRSSSNVRSLYS